LTDVGAAGLFDAPSRLTAGLSEDHLILHHTNRVAVWPTNDILFA
jgi:hypothetical protein